MNAESPKPPIEALELQTIRTDGGTQGRVSLDKSVVSHYAELMKSGVVFPPVRTWFDGDSYWLVDGFQRVAAAQQIGTSQIAAEVLFGTLEDARWDSYRSNGCHGVRRSEADIQLVLNRTFAHRNAIGLSNNEIARHLHLPEATVRRWRKRLSSSGDEDTSRLATRAGTVYKMQISKIGRSGNNGHDLRPKSRMQLQEDIEEMKASASPDARRVLAILGNWLRNNSNVCSTLSAIEGFILNLRR